MDAYLNTLDYLYNKLPMFQRIGPASYKHSLENTIRLDEMYFHPHKNFKTIHVAGTNGKGSVAHMIAAILQKAGYKTGLYTSPHLKDFRERIRINGKMIEKDFVVEWVNDFKNKNKSAKIEPSFFELTVLLSFDYFSKQKVDIAVIETGLGGRLDSTNIIHPELGIITNISLDHTALLGETLGEIANEKAGIIKNSVPIIIGQTQEEIKSVFIEKANDLKADLHFADQEYFADYSMMGIDGKQICNIRNKNGLDFPDLKIGLAGTYQRNNLPAVLKACQILKEMGWNLANQDIYDGLSDVVKLTGIMGRWQIIGNNPLIVCDTGHNAEGIKAVFQQINQTAKKNLHIVIGTVDDKDLSQILTQLPENAFYYFTKAKIPRSLNEEILKIKALDFGLKGAAYPTVSEALKVAKNAAEKNDLIFVGGSTFVVAEILS